MRARPARPLAALAVLGATALVAGCGSGGTSDAPAPSSSSSSSSGSSSSAATLKVVASTDVWGDIAKTVGGDAVEVTSFISDPSQDPHSYEASPRNQLVVSDADVVIENGGGYDDFMDLLVKASKAEAPVINAVEVSGFTDSGDGLNEHVWYDMPTVAKVADRVAAALGKADPAGADAFSANADALREELDTITASERGVAKEAQGTGIAITEPVPLYLTQACGLANDTPPEFSEAVEEGTDVSPAVLADTEALFTDEKVKALVYNEQTSGAETEAVLKAAKSADVAVVPVTETLPDGKDFVGWMRDNVAAVRAAVVVAP